VHLRLAVALLLVGSLPAAAQEAREAFSSSLPYGVGDVSRWQLVTGDFETPTLRGEYRFYVNPARGAMYQLMRYRVELLAATTAEQRRRGRAERVAFVRRPGVREPMAFWEKGAPGAPPWREILAGTDEYRMEVGVLMGVLGVHRAAPREGP
jgi:hypothetical protein